MSSVYREIEAIERDACFAQHQQNQQVQIEVQEFLVSARSKKCESSPCSSTIMLKT